MQEPQVVGTATVVKPGKSAKDKGKGVAAARQGPVRHKRVEAEVSSGPEVEEDSDKSDNSDKGDDSDNEMLTLTKAQLKSLLKGMVKGQKKKKTHKVKLHYLH